jgi:zinc/manganese transport system substrate-binding protein
MLRRPIGAVAAVTLVVTLVVTLTACATSRPGSAGDPPSAGVVRVVAAENFWGSIAAQIGGAQVEVVSIIDSPSADPHDYEPTAADARTVDQAAVAIGNGIGYDPWFGKLVSSDPNGPLLVDVGSVAGLSTGDNPHQWYSPTTVDRVISAITAALAKAAPAQSDTFKAGEKRFQQVTLLNYHSVIDAIKTTFANVAVGASESIFAPLAPSLGLRLITPSDFLAAVSEGTDPSATDKARVDAQIEEHQIKVWIYNSQNATPDVARLNAAAKAAGIPVVTVTETMTPAGANFQDWQTAQLTRLQAALAEAMK